MYFDFLNYQKFYDSTIGNSLSSHIESKLKKSCCLYEKQNIGCFGFCFPYLNFLKNYNSPISYCYPKKMGISEKHGGDYVKLYFERTGCISMIFSLLVNVIEVSSIIR